mgnify:CR=1 FL=1
MKRLKQIFLAFLISIQAFSIPSYAKELPDTTIYAYYNALNTDDRVLYTQVLDNFNLLNSKIKIKGNYQITDIKRIINSVLYDHPEIFWVSTRYSCEIKSSGKVVSINFEYLFSGSELNAAKNYFDTVTEAIVKNAKSLDTTEEKERFIADSVMEITTYATDNLSSPIYQTAYSAVCNKVTVCTGYAKLFSYLCNQVDIPTFIVTGSSDIESHAWNVVYIDGAFKNVDLTTEDQIIELAKETLNSSANTKNIKLSDIDLDIMYNITDKEFNDYWARGGTYYARSDLSKAAIPACE